jgi:hypothetical protein
VAEFKGPGVHGLVRFARLNDQEATFEAEFDGLTPGRVHRCSVNEYGDLREGAASTGSTYTPFVVGSLAVTTLSPLMQLLPPVQTMRSGFSQITFIHANVLSFWGIPFCTFKQCGLYLSFR